MAMTKLKQTCKGGASLVRLMASRPTAVFKPVRYLFLISHMRSRSSLLSHVLGSHPEITGYFESHIAYRHKLDFVLLRHRVMESLDGAPLGRYVLDKVLHRWYITPQLMNRMGARAVFLLRDPESSLKSLVASNFFNAPTPAATLKRATVYYFKQLKWIQKCCGELKTRGIFIESESLVNQTQRNFELLQERLELGSPLSESYQMFNDTGRAEYGDPSQLILAGQIVRDGRTSYSEAPQIPESTVIEARYAYDQCAQALRETCWHLD